MGKGICPPGVFLLFTVGALAIGLHGCAAPQAEDALPSEEASVEAQELLSLENWDGFEDYWVETIEMEERISMSTEEIADLWIRLGDEHGRRDLLEMCPEIRPYLLERVGEDEVAKYE